MLYLQIFFSKFSKTRVIFDLNLIKIILKTSNEKYITNTFLLWQETPKC
jgi:hypothetical protein